MVFCHFVKKTLSINRNSLQERKILPVFLRILHFSLKVFSNYFKYLGLMNSFSVKTVLRAGIKTLFFLSLFSGFYSYLALSETPPPGDLIPTVSERDQTNLLPGKRTWWSGGKAPDQFSIEEQIFNQLGSLTLLDLAPLSREELISKLKDDFNISIKADDPELFSRYFLAYLYSYFEMMFPQPFVFAPLYLHALSNSSPQLVRREGGNLYFSKNSGDRVINNTFGRFLFDEFSKSHSLPEELTVTFEYSNELYDQLNGVILTNQNIKGFIETHMGVTLGVEETDPLYQDTQPFVREELLMLLKQLFDMPFHLRDSMALKRIVRMRPGYQPPNAFEPVKATYNSNTQTIQFMDPTFELDGDSRGKKTILHEIAHAVWFNFSASLWYGLPLSIQKEYAKLSWRGDTKISDEFISNYSASDVVEDFAEHVAFYIDNSEKLKKETPEKFKWLKKYIFFNVEYFTDAAGNVKIFVSSEQEDSTPPYFVNSSGESITLSVEGGIFSDKVKMIAEIEGLFDDISGVEDIFIALKSKDDYLNISVFSINDRSCLSPEGLSLDDLRVDCVITDKNRPGWYVIQEKKDRDTAYPGFYEVKYISVEDYAGNSKTFRSQLGNQLVYFPGTKEEPVKKPLRPIVSDKKSIGKNIEKNAQFIVSKMPEGDTLVHVVIPDIHHPTLGNIFPHLEQVILRLKGMTTERRLSVHIYMSQLPQLHSRFNSPKETGKIVLPVVIPKELVSEQYEVSDIEFLGQAFSMFSIAFDGVLYFNHVSDQEDKTAPRVRKGDISLRVLNGLNSEGGDTSLLATIPVEGFDLGKKRFYYVTIRTPNGKTLLEMGTMREVFKKDENGNQYISVQFDLKPHHLQGEYLISSVSLTESYPVQIPGLWIVGNEQRTEDRLIERGIRATVHITAPTAVE